jgi:apolipoprotein N-acyltransferase
VDAAHFAWLIPFAVFGIGAGLGLFFAFAMLVFAWQKPRLVLYQQWILFVLTIGCAEWLRGHILTGFPWNLLGYMWTINNVAIQSFSFLGVYLLSAFSWLIVTLPVYVWRVRKEKIRSTYWLLPSAVLVVMVTMLVAGAIRLHTTPTSFNTQVKLRIVQGNIPQSLKWEPKMRLEAVSHYAALSMMEGAESITHFIWPETAMTFPFSSGDYWANELAGILTGKQILLTGVMRVVPQKHLEADRYYNSLQALDAKARVVLTYDKIHLVPFGEYVPLRSILPLEKITQGSVDFSAGTPQPSHSLGGLPPFRPIICYESIFPELSKGAHPAWLLNITNDAWFGDSSAPYQLLQMSRARAVENGVPLIRAANTGISAVIDAHGRVLQYLPLDHDGVIDSYLPNILENNSFYNLYGEYMCVIIAMGCVLCCLKITRVK